MKLYNTLSEKKERLAKPKGRLLKMFVCGPTVYDYSHIGHARTYLVYDALVRYLRWQKFKVFYLQNITDVDDKIIERASRTKSDFGTKSDFVLGLAHHFEKKYFEDMKALGITAVDKYARASEHLKEIFKQIATLIKKGYGYETKNGVYFEIKKFKDYGKLSKQNLDKLRPGWRIEPDPEKKDPLDFALWKRIPKTNYGFESPWGFGRPGWHIEDTAISEKYLGPQYDLHGAAIDLKFPHHESEIAQQEAASGKKPFVKLWMHAGFLLVDSKKMSKSLGNFITIRDFLKKYPADVLRLIVLSHHYRSPINYTEQLAQQQKSTLENIEQFLHTLTSPPVILRAKPEESLKDFDKQFTAALDDDFNTPKALAEIFDFMGRAPKTEQAKKMIVEKLTILGFDISLPKIPAEVKKLFAERKKLRRQKEFGKADQIRAKIKQLNFLIED
ncbi:MAG: cysteine--tRNA ligase [Patescibacteria group bacterium]